MLDRKWQQCEESIYSQRAIEFLMESGKGGALLGLRIKQTA